MPDSPAPGLRVLLGSPAALEDAFLAEVAGRRARNALAPIDVLVGGILQRPYLQRLIADNSPGLLNVRFSTLGELGVRLGEPSLAASGRRPLPAIAERAYVREVARASHGYFEPVAATPGFAEVARRLLRELRQEGVAPETLERLAPTETESAAKGEALADLYARYLDGRGGAYDGEDALAAADPDRFDGIALLMYGIWRLSAVGRWVIALLAERVPVVVLLPSVAPDADAAHAELREWLEQQGATIERLAAPAPETTLAVLQQRLFAHGAAVEQDETVDLLTAPDPLSETREAARTCLAWAAEGIAFREMAVAYRQAETYRPLVEAVFAETGIPVYLDDGPSLAERPLGRRVLALLDLVDSPLRRRDVIAFLSDGRMPKETRERFGGAPAARWDSASRRAGVVEGIDQWRQRLGLLREREAEAAAGEGAPEWLQRRVEDVDGLLAFVDSLAGDLERHPKAASWADSLSFLGGLLTTYVDGVEDVLGYLDQLAELDLFVPEIEFERFLDVVRAEIKGLKAGDLDEGQQGAFGRRGVNVLDANQLRGLRFRAVALLGLTERSFPPPPRQDPLLLDDERRRLNEAGGLTLPLRAWGADPEPLQFALGVHAARERLLLSTRRAEEAGGRVQLPSSFFRAAAAVLEGRRVMVAEVDNLPSVRHLPAGRVGAGELERALTVDERDRTLLELDEDLGQSVLEWLEPRAARADDLRRARWATRALTAYDGTFTDPAASASLEERLASQVFHPTGLESYAECPFRYFLRTVLRVRPLEEPEAVMRMEAMTKGNVMHAILERFVLESVGPRVPADADEHRRALLTIAEEELERAESEGLTGTAVLWRADRREILDDLTAWLNVELSSPAYTDSFVEVTFGQVWSDSPRSPLAADEPLVLRVDGREIRIGGKVDRIDTGAEGAYRVTDYKSGSGSYLPKDGQLKGGRALQLPLYLLAGAMLLESDPGVGEAAYQVISRRGRLKRIAFTGADLDARRADFDLVLGRIVSGIADGDFHAAPSDDACRYCDFNGLCDVGRNRIYERKQADPRITSFGEMREIG